MSRIVVALIGQPNVGKSTLFNVLAREHVIVTNWPGTTVERHEGRVLYNGYEITLIDLPGVYSLTGLTLEEKISRDFILKNKPDVLIVLADSLELKRTLYLAVEILEFTSKVILAITKVDEAHSRGIHINYELLEKTFKAFIVPISAVKGIGIKSLLEKVINCINNVDEPLVIDYGELEVFIDTITSMLHELASKFRYPMRWIAIKILEGDENLINELKEVNMDIYRRIEEIRLEAMRRFGPDLTALISKKRFEFIESATRNAIIKVNVPRSQGRCAQVFYNPYLAPLISVALLLCIFIVVFIINTGYPLTLLLKHLGFTDAAIWLENHNLNMLIENVLEFVSNTLYNVLGKSIIVQFIVEGVLGGIFALMLFIPLITVVLVILGVFEDSGILTRMAIGLHMFLQKVMFSGHSVFPFSLSLGCNVPGLLATRANLNSFERIRLLMLIPFIPCQARLIIILTFASAIGGTIGTILVPLAYILSFSLVIGFNLVISSLARKQGKEDSAELLLALPPIHKPIPKVVWWFTWFYLKHFIIKVGTIIMFSNVMVWILSNISINLTLTDNINTSLAATLSKYLSPILIPLGITNEYSWIIVFALITGFIAKELFLTTILTITGVESLRQALELLRLNPPSVAALTIFVTLYVPCIATISTIHIESKNYKLTLGTTLLMIIVAFTVSAIVYAFLNIIT
ncbi:MAG: ferrous iron transport protein B [Ignisphaera sp.]|uniref:Ferrous iron transport protein B n=1 Tax=Ignisphaera aggregans TaxID=334771 RepID=A0A832FY73_9CREN